MKNLLFVSVFLFFFIVSFSQRATIKAEKYPSLLWEIKDRNGKISYLFGTMHVSSKMVFHLSDSFYLAIRKAQVVALETNPGTWQEDFSHYDLEGEGFRGIMNRFSGGGGLSYALAPRDYLTINTLRLRPFEKKMEAALYSSPSMINSFLYRSNSEAQSDFEEDTYLDLHIFQTGRKLGKRICGVEDFDGSMRLVKEAYSDAAKEKKKQSRPDYDEDFSYARMEEAYRTGNLDLLDTINKVNSQSAAFDEKFLYKRNEIQAASIDSILRSGASLFVGVGAAHLPGSRGVIELLRKKGYSLRPMRMTEHNSLQKETIEKIRVPVKFSKQTSEDGFYSVSVPGKLYSFGRNYGGIDIKQCADMTNGSYYMVTRILTNAAIMGQSQQQVEQKLDSVLYENIPGKLLTKKPIVKNGYRGYEIINRTRRGDLQRYNVFITPFELILFKMSGNGDYVKGGAEAEQFFGSIQLKGPKMEWKTWTPPNAGFEVELPHQPSIFKGDNWVCAAYDSASQTAFEIIRTDVHNYEFLEQDSFDLNLMEESFASSDCIARSLSRRNTNVNGYPALDLTYRYKDSSVAMVRFLIQGPHYYTIVANAEKVNPAMSRAIKSFVVEPFHYGEASKQSDTVLRYTVVSPVALEKKEKLQMYPTDVYGMDNEDPDDSLLDNGDYKSRLIVADSTGEKILVAFYKPSRYFSRSENEDDDSAAFKKEWVIRKQKRDTLVNGTVVSQYELGNKESSRLLKEKSFSRDKAGYTLITLLDTLSAPSLFVSSFFQQFSPIDSLVADGWKNKKTSLFFSHLFSADTSLRKKALKNISGISVDSADFSKLKQGIESLTWRDKKYLTAKEDLIGRLSQIKTDASSDYLQSLYNTAGDTVELQYAILETLLEQQTAYAYHSFGELMQTDPPVLDMNTADNLLLNTSRRYFHYDIAKDDDEDVASITTNGSFLEHLTDSLALTAGIFKKLLPLINADDYEEPMMNLMKVLVDSGYLHPANYEAYLPKFLLEAKQALKKQLISEKSKAIAQAQKDDNTDRTTASTYHLHDELGNEKLGLYATLLLPFWDQSPQVPQLVNRLLQSENKRIKYTTAILLLRNHRPAPDSMWTYFASQDEYRYDLFTDLKKLGRLSLFPDAYKTQLLLAKSKLLGLEVYNKPDTVAYVAKMLLAYKAKTGNLYIFKYKEKTEDNGWKLATVGLFPQDTTQMEFDLVDLTKSEKTAFDFTELTDTKLSVSTPESEQLEKLRKRMLNSRRKSGAQFYEPRNGYDDMEYGEMR